MAKFVVAGCSDCPYFAKVELLADRLSINVPNFHVHKIVKTRKEWNAWSSELSKTNHWNVKESPIIWRELVDRGGKGHLIGGANEFQEYVKCYYNIISDFTSVHMQDIAKDNIRFKEEEDRENREFKALSTPMKICIVNAVNEAVPHFVLSLAKGDVINKTTELSIVFLDKTEHLTLLKGLQMGTFDLAHSLVRSISITDNYEAGFIDSSLIVVFDETVTAIEADSPPSKESLEYYEYIGNVVEKYCLTDVKVLLVPTNSSNLVNINLISMHQMLQRISKFNVVGLSRPIEQQLRSVIAKKLLVNPSNVHNLIVWGNIGGKKFFDISKSRVHQFDGSIMGPEPFSIAVDKAIWDKKWLKTEMESLVEKRFAEISEFRGKVGNPVSVSMAVITFLRQWFNGDDNGYIHSLTVASEGWYGVPDGMAFSFPVTLNPRGYWTVVQDIELSETQFKRINECVQDVSEKLQIFYPWMNNSNTLEMVVDESFIDSQIYALLQELYSKAEIPSIRSLINSSLMLEDKIEISRSKDLLLSTVADLQKPAKVQEVGKVHEAVAIQTNQNAIVENDQNQTDANVIEIKESSEKIVSDEFNDDLEDDHQEENNL